MNENQGKSMECTYKITPENKRGWAYITIKFMACLIEFIQYQVWYTKGISKRDMSRFVSTPLIFQ